MEGTIITCWEFIFLWRDMNIFLIYRFKTEFENEISVVHPDVLFQKENHNNTQSNIAPENLHKLSVNTIGFRQA